MTQALGTTAAPVPVPSSRPVHRRRRILPNLFGIPFGIAGLAEAWKAAKSVLGTPHVVADSIDGVAAAAWFVVVVAYFGQGPRRFFEDLKDQTVGPFVSLAWICPMLLAASAAGYAFDAARVLVVVFLVTTIGVGGWMTGQWLAGEIGRDAIHPGYFLPTVAGGLVGGACAAEVHLHSVAEASFGIGMLCWILLGSLILNRLFLRPSLPPTLQPTLAIEVAPPVVGGVAYAQITSGAADTFAFALAGYAVLMALVQLRLLPLYLKLRYTPSFWAFTFSYAAGAADALNWLTAEHPPGTTAYAVLVVALITLFILAIAARTLLAAVRGELLPPPPRPEPATAVPTQ